MIVAAVKLQILWWYQNIQIHLRRLSISEHVMLIILTLAVIYGYNYWLFSIWVGV